MMTRLPVALLALAVPAAASAAVLGTASDFTDGENAGWDGGRGQYQLEVVNSGGPAGDDDPFLQLITFVQMGAGSIPAMYNLDEAWTGDYRAAGVGGVSVDVQHADPNTPLSLRLVLFNGDGNRWTSRVAYTPPTDGSWNTAVFSTAEADLLNALGSSTYDELIGNVTRVMLRHDEQPENGRGTAAMTGVGFDNITLVDAAAVPEPAAIALFALAALPLRRRR